MKVAIDKCGYTIWTFRPTSKQAASKMRRLFPHASWTKDGVMLVEHRYEVEAAKALIAHDVTLVRDSDGATLHLQGGTFVVGPEVANV